ncbi:hypothetical protein NDU88_003440 [Pleurodeles waltl]|uniref:Uncharacterized protein n=1 Tax=Pleurodeles waltl TaxID=8319 RepID=A0AAV7UE25_PLEWA|nr:hypothetical protein NDU88_003440 [Pleurodeles waltl]
MITPPHSAPGCRLHTLGSSSRSCLPMFYGANRPRWDLQLPSSVLWGRRTEREYDLDTTSLFLSNNGSLGLHAAPLSHLSWMPLAARAASLVPGSKQAKWGPHCRLLEDQPKRLALVTPHRNMGREKGLSVHAQIRMGKFMTATPPAGVGHQPAASLAQRVTEPLDLDTLL